MTNAPRLPRRTTSIRTVRTLPVTSLASGADLHTVKERLGHGSIITTEKYLHTLAETDDTALTALASIRQRHRQG